MFDVMIDVVEILFCAVQGYCVQYLFRGFMQPKLHHIRISHWLVGVVWVGIRYVGETLFHGQDITMDNVSQIGRIRIGELFFCTAALFVFCMCWYQGKNLLKFFLVIQFISLRQLTILAGYSLMYIGTRLFGLLEYELYNGVVRQDKFLLLVNITSVATLALVSAAQGALLYFFIRKIVKSYYFLEMGRMNREVFFYLLPAVTGILIDALVRLMMNVVEDGNLVFLYMRYPVLYLMLPIISVVLLMAIVFSFQIYQEMAGMQKERAERIVLENQIAQMQNSMVEMEHLYEGVRAVKHDMKNHMEVLQELLQKSYPYSGRDDEEIMHYFEGMYQAVEQLDDRVHTGNAVSDAVINSKFFYAQKVVQDIRLDASEFILADAIMIKAYDIGIILNNGLDNAIEACTKLRMRQPETEVYITIRSFWAGNMYFIEIENSFDGVILLNEDGSFPISTKEDKEVHGIGLRNIKNCAVKYGGDMDCIVEGNRFILSVMVRNC